MGEERWIVGPVCPCVLHVYLWFSGAVPILLIVVDSPKYLSVRLAYGGFWTLAVFSFGRIDGISETIVHLLSAIQFEGIITQHYYTFVPTMLASNMQVLKHSYEHIFELIIYIALEKPNIS